MKKILYSALVAVAIASFGVHSGLVHAQTAQTNSSPSAAVLQQELDVAKATLVNLEMKAGMVPAGDATLPGGSTVAPAAGTTSATPAASTGLSASDRAALSSALGSLVSALSSLNATIAANPTSVTSHQAAIASVLSGMQSTLVAMNRSLNGGSVSGGGTSAPVAAGTPSAGSGSGIAQSQPGTTPTTQPSTGSLTPTAPAAGGAPQQTAQASNAWGFVVAHWPTITIVILVALILLILFWPSKGDDNGNRESRRAASKPQPNRPIAPMASQNVRPSETHATPVTVVSSPAAKVTVIRPQNEQPAQQQKKPA